MFISMVLVEQFCVVIRLVVMLVSMCVLPPSRGAPEYVIL